MIREDIGWYCKSTVGRKTIDRGRGDYPISD